MPDSITPSLARFAASRNPEPPARLGIRYDADGHFLQEPGNTVVCHLLSGSPSETALLRVRDRMMGLPGADGLAFTPPSSLHMTVRSGIIDSQRQRPYWPTGISLDTKIDDMTQKFMSRLEGFDGCGRFEIKVTDIVPTGLTVEGATELDRQAMRAWRDKLAETFGYRHPNHDTYRFHITFAYLLRGIPDDRIGEWQFFVNESLAYLERTAPVIELRSPAFCRFRTMERFEELLVLA